MREPLQQNAQAEVVSTTTGLLKDGLKFVGTTLTSCGATLFGFASTKAGDAYGYMTTSRTQAAIEKIINRFSYDKEKRFKELLTLADKKLIRLDPRFVAVLIDDYEKSKDASYINTVYDTGSKDTKDLMLFIFDINPTLKSKTQFITKHMEKLHGRMCQILWEWHVENQRLFSQGEKFVQYYNKLRQRYPEEYPNTRQAQSEEFERLLFGESRILTESIPAENRPAPAANVPAENPGMNNMARA